MTKEQAFIEINQTQDEYISELIGLIDNKDYMVMKSINFTSATGTGKTKMMSKLINHFPEYYFIVTTLSKGQLHLQIRDNLLKDCNQENFYVYGSADYKINSKLDAMDILGRIPQNTKCIWLRDEGHIKTNRFEELLQNNCYKVINFSATNMQSDIQCNFAHTMMLRTVNQTNGTPEDAITKLIEIKKIHKGISNYNPCAIFRCVGGNDCLYREIKRLCKQYKLKHIDITDDPIAVSELCKDDNEYDVIINKFKITEGIDIRRAHVLFMDNKPNNNATTIQVIGRCRRNALLYRNDIDIFSPSNAELLKKTRECFVYYNIEKMKIDTDENGELQYAFCNYISCEALKPNTVIEVVNGQLSNGLYVLELENETGEYKITVDQDTGFNVVEPLTDFYETECMHSNQFIYFDDYGSVLRNSNSQTIIRKVNIKNVPKFPFFEEKEEFDYSTRQYKTFRCEPYYLIRPYNCDGVKKAEVSDNVIELFDSLRIKYSEQYLRKKLSSMCIDTISPNTSFDESCMKEHIFQYIEANKETSGLKVFCRNLSKFSIKSKHPLYYLCSEIGGYNSDIPSFFYFIFDKEDTLWINQLKYNCVLAQENGCDVPYIWNKVGDYLRFIYENRYALSDNNSSDIDFLAGIIPLFFDESKPEIAQKELVSNIPKNRLFVFHPFNEGIVVKNNDIYDYFERLDKSLSGQQTDIYGRNKKIVYCSSLKTCLEQIQKELEYARIELTKKEILAFSSYHSLFEVVTDTEKYLLKKGILESNFVKFGESDLSLSHLKKEITVKEYEAQISSGYEKIVNDKESAIIGVDTMHQIKNDDNEVFWTEAKAVSLKISGYTKFNSFLTRKYSKELEYAKPQCFTGKNDFKLNKKCNSMIGYCVEYYSKYLLYGDAFLGDYIREATYEARTSSKNDIVIIRACMLKYREMMVKSFGKGVSKVIKSITAKQLNNENFDYFVNLVVTLGTKTAQYVKKKLYPDSEAVDNIDPNLSINHIAGLADYITPDTILDVKVRNSIDEKCVRQVLAYHYLSTKRSDLDIKRVIVYDAVSDKAVVIPIGE